MPFNEVYKQISLLWVLLVNYPLFTQSPVRAPILIMANACHSTIEQVRHETKISVIHFLLNHFGLIHHTP